LRRLARVLFSARGSQGFDEVAVVIPTRNRWRLLRAALASALVQRDVDVEVVVVDDGSVDATRDQLGALRDRRVRILRSERSGGVSAARNLGLAHVSSPWVAFLDDDDVWAPDHLSAMLMAFRRSALAAERLGLVYSGHLDVNAERVVTHVSPADPAESVPDGLKRMNLVGCPSRVVLPTDAVRAVGGFDVTLSIVADWDLWVRVLADRKAVRCPELLVGYMRHPGNMHLDAERFLGELETLREKHGWSKAEPRGAVFGDLLPAYVAATYRTSGRRGRAALWYARAFRARRKPRDLARAIGVLLGERLIDFSGLRMPNTVDPRLGGWLEVVRRAERETTTGLLPLPGIELDRAAP
jgi:glycosyltransferase involved in cell wall biosynthesis